MENEKVLWYWEYTVKTWDVDEEKETYRSGVTAAHTMTEAMESIEDYYGDEILAVVMLKAITDVVLDFDFVNCDSDFDFTINRK